MSSSDKDIYRTVPYRFLINETNADKCKLEKLTNLFPDMKGIIELESFKINNLTRMIDRLSSIYTVLTAVDTRDDTLHLFLGPYHLSLGAAIFGALQFRNLSTALLASSHSKTSGDNTNQQQKRRHEAIIRRFRRSVRKLILIKSIIDQIRLASILTPYNQYELYTNGIYDLVLAGHIHKSHSVFNDDDFNQQINDFRSMNNFQKENSLLASRFVKIQALLQLLSPIPHQNQSDNNSILGQTTQTRSDEITNENPSKPKIDSSNLCCSQHNQSSPLVKFPINRSISQQSNQFFSNESNSRRNSRYKSRRDSSARSKLGADSLPDLSDGNNPSNSNTLESKNVLALQSKVPSSSSNKNQEDAFINRISTLLTNYVLSRTNDNHERFGDSTDSLSSLPNTIASDDVDISNKFSSAIETNEFDKLLKRIKTVVDNNLSVHQNLSNNFTKTTANDLRQELLISRTEPHHEGYKDENDVEHLKPSIHRNKLRLSAKSQSVDENDLELFLTIPASNDNSVEF